MRKALNRTANINLLLEQKQLKTHTEEININMYMPTKYTMCIIHMKNTEKERKKKLH